MVLVISKTSAGRAAVGALAPGGGGGEGVIVWAAFRAQGARHHDSGATRPRRNNTTTRRTAASLVASTPEAFAGRRACTWHQLAGWCHVAFLGTVSSRRLSRGPRRRCAGPSTLLRSPGSGRSARSRGCVSDDVGHGHSGHQE